MTPQEFFDRLAHRVWYRSYCVCLCPLISRLDGAFKVYKLTARLEQRLERLPPVFND